jgi:hypothetical protein
MLTSGAASGASGVGVGVEPGPSDGNPPLPGVVPVGSPIKAAASGADMPLTPALDAATGLDAAPCGAPSKGGNSRGAEASKAPEALEACDAAGATGATGAGFGAT